MRSLRPGSRRAVIVLLMALLAVSVAVEGSYPTHSHGDGRPALYNAECPLAELSAVRTAAWAPEPLTIASPEPTVLRIPVTSAGRAPSPGLSLTDSRAPPLA